VVASNFSLTFDVAGEPTEDDLRSTGDIVISYLGNYVTLLFQSDPDITLISRSGSITVAAPVESLVSFYFLLLFSDDSSYFPGESDIFFLDLYSSAFQVPSVGELLARFESDLSSDNPLRFTSAIFLRLTDR